MAEKKDSIRSLIETGRRAGKLTNSEISDAMEESGNVLDVGELCAAATADGYPFDAEEQIARIRLHLQKAPDGFTSIYADLKAGRRTEVDVINGAVVEAGHRHNIPVPTHEFVVELVHAMEGRA